MRDHDELRVGGHLDDLISKASHVRFVKRRVDLVQQTERRRTVMEDAQDERKGSHRLLAAGQQQHVLQTFYGWLSNDVDARLEHVVGVDQTHFAASTAKQLLEQRAEILVDLFERVTETLARAALDLAQRFFVCRYAVDDVLPLHRQEQQTLLGFRQFFERHHVHGAKAIETRTQLFDARMARVEVKIFGQRDFTREIFQRLARLRMADFVDELLPRLRFRALHFQTRTSI